MGLRDDLESELAPLLAPLPGEGRDLSLDPTFERIKAEIDKLTNVAGGKPDWTEVTTGVEALLRERTKDFRLIVWWAVARAQRSGGAPADVAAGALLMLGTARDFWDQAFPEVRRLRGRANLYAWLTEQMDGIVAAHEATAAERESAELADAMYNELDGLLSERLGEMHPGPGRLRSSLRRLVQAAASAVAPAAPPPRAALVSPARRAEPSADDVAPDTSSTFEPTGEGGDVPLPGYGGDGGGGEDVPVSFDAVASDGAYGSAVAGGGEGLRAPSSPDEATAALEAATTLLFDIADVLRGADPSSPLPYRLARIAARLLPAGSGDLALVVEPDYENFVELTRQLRTASWTAVVDAAERALRTSPYWLELHCLVSLALDRQGFAAARAAADRGALEIIDSFEGEPTFHVLQFASPNSRAWLAALRGGKAATPASPESFRPAIDRRGELPRALGEAVSAANRAGTGRDRFRGLLAAGEFALERGQAPLARAMLDGLLEDVERHGLEVWDPALCAALYRTLISAMRAEGSDKVDQSAKEQLLFEKLCRIDPRAALELSRSS